jgi:hypothetical protein
MKFKYWLIIGSGGGTLWIHCAPPGNNAKDDGDGMFAVVVSWISQNSIQLRKH